MPLPLPLLLPAPQIEELSLSGNQRRSDMLRRRLRFKAGDSLTNSTWLEGGMGGGATFRGAGSSASSAASAAGAAELAGAEIIDCRSECACSADVCIEADCCSRWLARISPGLEAIPKPCNSFDAPPLAASLPTRRRVPQRRAAGDPQAHGGPHLQPVVQALLRQQRSIEAWGQERPAGAAQERKSLGYA